MSAPGLGLTPQQLQQLLANLKKLLKDSTGDGAELLASLLAASQLAATIQPNDLAALTQLLGTTAQGTVSIDALESNLLLLTQAIQMVASSGGEMTLTQAVQELTPPGDAFTQQLAAVLAQPDATQADASDVPLAVDTGPPQGQGPGDAAGAQASATAGSNGRELTVTPQGATSPADGAAEEANSTDTAALAKAIEALFQSQPQAKAGQPGASGPSQAVPGPAAGVQPIDPATQLAQMAPAQAVTNQAKAAVHDANQAPSDQHGDKSDATPSASEQQAVTTAPTAGVIVQTGAQERETSQDNGRASAGGSATPSQPTIVPVAPQAPSTFSAALDAAHAAEAPARPAVEQAIVDQIVQTATLALNSGQQEFRIQLKPDFLGAMEVRVSVGDNGVVDVRMSVESAATRQLIDNNISQLRQAFGNGDVRVQHVPNFAASDAPWTFGQGGQQGFWQGQHPFSGSQMPEAIPFSEPEGDAAPVGAAAAAAPVSASPVTSPAGAVDLQA